MELAAQRRSLHTQKVLRRRERNEQRLEKRRELGLPRYTLGEEIFSSVSHGVSALLAAGALAGMLLVCRKTPLVLGCVLVYGASMILLYTVSAVYHGLGLNRAKRILRSIDHCTVFVLIAGTYTPMSLLGIGGLQGALMLAAVWTAAVVGIVLNAVSVERFKVFSMVCYLAMGWVVLLAMKTVLRNLSPAAFGCLLAGGICYTLGACLYGAGRRVPYMHSVFHLFVAAGTALHTITVFSLIG